MSIEERDKPTLREPGGIAPQELLEQRHTAVPRFLQRREPDLTKPFGTPYWPLAIPALLCTLLAVLLFTRVIDLGMVSVTWTIRFDVNIAAALLVVLAGVVLIAPRVIKNPQVLRDSTTIISFVVLALGAVFFLARLLNLGTFVYSVSAVDINALVGLLLIVAIIVLAFRGSTVAVFILVCMFLWWGFTIKGFGLSTISDLFTSEDGGRLLRNLTPPRWDYFGDVIDPLFITVKTAIASTIIGIVCALPLSILAARNTSPHPVIYNVVRLIVNTIRAVPALVLALLFIPFVGLGPAAGILGLGIHSISVLTKLYAESFESVKPQPLEALSAVGANGLKTFRWGVFPQAFPLLASYSFYNWESNGRDATVVAFVGGGGLGLLLQQNLSLLDYERVSVILIVLVIAVALLDRLSDFMRSMIL